ncbi:MULTISPECIES: DUF5309 family protein [unclassified Bradyrhizobium]|uniref:SU10 major capsid protein n=1 Tax=unclassified Bradyrhizobium TaxID=2631580 RepID=UPI00291651F0|nr:MULTISPECIES: DUF5309 family protein [unclassified Bradyrhizobium]
MSTYTSYDLNAVKENVSNVITNLTPRKTPFQSGIGDEKVTQPLFQWQEDSLRDVQDNAAVEGADATFVNLTPTVMRNNYTQIFQEAIEVSDRADVTATYGKKREFAYQMAKTAAQVKRDREYALVGKAGDKNAGSKTVASTMAGVQKQIDPSCVIYTGASDGSKPLDEDHLVTALKTAYNNGADVSRIMVTPDNSIVLAGFAKAAGRYRTIQGSDAKKIVNVVNLYVSPFGEQKVEINRFMRHGNTLVFEPEQWTNVTFRPWARKDLAKTGDATKAQLLGEFSLKHKNYKASAMIVEAATGF